ncbi:hypothetical protein D3C76_1600720 [compost metagenome]
MNAQHCAQVLDRLIRDELGQGEGMGANVTNAAAQTGLFRFVAPLCLLVPLPGHILA